MTKINYKSDFDFILKLKDCADPKKTVPFPEGDFDARFWTSNKANAYIASCRDGVYTNCFRTEDGGMHFVFDDHRMGKGTLHWEPHFELPNDIYPDNMQDLYRKAALDIELVDGDGDCPTTAELEAMLPYIKGPKGDKGDKGDKGNKGDAFTYDDFTPEQIEGLQRPATEAAQRLQEFQTTAEANESEREEAEGKRAEEFADWKAEIDSKADRSELSNVFAEEPLTPDNFPDIDTYTREELKMDLFIDLWDSAWWERNRFGKETIWGKYDPDNAPDAEHPFYGNKLWMTYEEAIRVLLAGRLKFLKESEYYKYNCNIRTNLPPERGATNSTVLNATFYDAAYIETALLRNDVTLKATFDGCKRLREVLSINTIRSSDLQAFRDCANLEFVEFRGVTGDIYLQYCPKIKIESLNLLVSTAQNKTSISVCVHPDVFAKLTDETNTEWHPLLALAAEKNISFATI